MPATKAVVIRPIPYREPLNAFAPLAGTAHAALLDSAVQSEQGRYSFIAFDPFRVITGEPLSGRVSVDGREIAEVASTLSLSTGAVHIARSRVRGRLRELVKTFDHVE